MKAHHKTPLFGSGNDAIITTLLEADTYKFLMMYFLWTYVPDVQAVFAFTNRTRTVALGRHVDVQRLRAECDAVRTLRFTEQDIAYMARQQVFSLQFLDALRAIVLPAPEIAATQDGQLSVRVCGPWWQVTLWETMLLAIINQLYAASIIGNDSSVHRRVIVEGERRLLDKAALLRTAPVHFLQFGMRRRLSSWWERHVTRCVQEQMPDNMVAVSNVAIAREMGCTWGGTNAHELYSGFEALRRCDGDGAAIYAQYEVLEKWRALFPYDVRIMLPDTFGSMQFFAGLPEMLAHDFRGARQDSGDPEVFGRMLINTYIWLGIDPRTKVLLFSDGLDAPTMVRLQKLFARDITVRFGWGTNLTNDTGFVQPVSIVMKLIEVDGIPAVKLSDNVAKAIGVPDIVAQTKNLFGYTTTFSQACVY